jgi:hypothetical protein
MTASAALAYHRRVPAFRSGAWPWIAAGALLFCAVFSRPAAARAATASYSVADAAVVQVIGRNASITIRTWNRDTVQIDWPDGGAFVTFRGTVETPPSFPIPTVSVEEARPTEGPVVATLLPEDFPVPQLPPGRHDLVRVVENPQPGIDGRPAAAGALTVLIPESTGLVNVRSGKGAVTLLGYHGTTIAFVRGRLQFENVGGDAFVQPLNGRFSARNSSFDRLRIRSNRADQIFDGCRVKQIEATTLTGNIVFNNGVFDPGLARFDSDRGSIALGVNGGAQVGAHSGYGHVFTLLPEVPVPPILAREAADGVQVVGNGGPLVNASSNHGDVFLYDGSLAERRPGTLAPAWHPIYALVFASRESAAERRPAFFMARPPSRPAFFTARPPPRPQIRRPPMPSYSHR